MSFRQDYLLRMIEQLGEALRRIAGVRKRGDFEQAHRDVESLWDKHIDVAHDLVDLVDTHTLAGMLREPGHMRAAAMILAEEARCLADKGDPMHAARRYKTAFELLLEANDPADADLKLELSRHVHANLLDERYR